MIFHFQPGNVSLHEEDKAYFEAKCRHLCELLGSLSRSEDSVDVSIKLNKNKHHSGEKFECAAKLVCPMHGPFHTDVTGDSLKHLAERMHDKLKAQIRKFHDKKVNK